MKNQLTRRDFIKLVGAAGGGLVLAVYSGRLRLRSPDPGYRYTTKSHLHAPLTFRLVSKLLSEDGPGWHPDDLCLSLRDGTGDSHRHRHADRRGTGRGLEFRPHRAGTVQTRKYGDQLTGGSVSVSSYYAGLRRAGAAARQMLVEAAADAWDVDPAQCKTEAGFVIHPDSQQKIFYGDLVESASKLEMPKEANIKDPAQFKIVGTGKGHWDAPQIVSGKAIYGLDVRLPDMLFAVLARCPVFGGKVASFDDSAAKTVPGVRQIVSLEDSIAVVAENTWAAIQGRNALTITWDEGKMADKSSETLREAAQEHSASTGPEGKCPGGHL